MPYCKTAYETTMGKISDMRKVEQGLKAALIADGLADRTLGVQAFSNEKAVFLIGNEAVEMNVFPFIHPYLIENFKGKDYLVTDARLFRNVKSQYASEQEFETGIRNKTEYSLMKSRSVLNLLWMAEDPKRLLTRFSFAGNVFSAWISQAVSRAFALNMQEQVWVTAAAMYYYHTLFTPATRLDGDALETAVVHTIKAVKLPANEIYEMFEQFPEVRDINDICGLIRAAVPNVRLDNLNLPMLLTLIRNTWFGTNAKDMISVALEHPPTWISIVYATLTERSYKSSTLYGIIEFQSKRGNGDEFKMNFVDQVMDRILITEQIDNVLVFREFED